MGKIMFAGLMLLLLILFFGDILSDPFNTVLGRGGDATKNYYTPWYHVDHDSSYHWFSGMNYPYGDQIVYADAQPALSNAVKWLSGFTGISGAHMPGIMNLLMILSIAWAGWLIFLILRRIGVPDAGAGIAAVLIAGLSPQIMRMNGHFALAYSCFVPLIWYLTLRYRENFSLKWSILLALTGILFSGLHPYYLMILTLFLGAVFLMDLILKPGGANWKIRLMHLGIQVVIPLITFKAYLALTDPVLDRPVNPYGFMAYTSSWKSVFFDQLLPFIENARKAIGFREVHPEGYAYTGTAGLVFVLTLMIFLIKGFIRKQWHTFRQATGEKEDRIFLLASLLIFLFASGYLFPGKLGEWVGSIPFLAQFRSTGRFTWIFYFIWAAYSWKFLWNWITLEKPKNWIKPVMGGILLLAAFGETGYHLHLLRTRQIQTEKLSDWERKAWEMLPSEPHLSQFNAIITAPYYHIGSENFASRRRSDTGAEMYLSALTGKPLMNASLSRTSFSQSWKLVQFGLLPLENPELLSDLPHNWKILNLENPEARKKGLEIPWEKQFLFKSGEWYGYALTREMLEKTKALLGKTLNDVQPDSLFPTTEPIFWAETPKMEIHEGKGHLLFPEIPKTGMDSARISISLWARLRKDQLPTSRLNIRQEGSSGFKKTIFVQGWVRALAGEWALIEVPVQVPDENMPVKLKWIAKGEWKNFLEIRNLLIREQDKVIRHEVGGKPARNNLFIPVDF